MKLKLYYLSRIMLKKTDSEHMINMAEILTALEDYGVTAERKSLYDDLESFRILGIDVIGERKGRNSCYYVGSKQFDIAELKLIVDAIQSSKFITEKKTNELIKKLTDMASIYEAEQLKREVEFYATKNYRMEETYLIEKYYRQNNKLLPFANVKHGDSLH